MRGECIVVNRSGAHAGLGEMDMSIKTDLDGTDVEVFGGEKSTIFAATDAKVADTCPTVGGEKDILRL